MSLGTNKLIDFFSTFLETLIYTFKLNFVPRVGSAFERIISLLDHLNYLLCTYRKRRYTLLSKLKAKLLTVVAVIFLALPLPALAASTEVNFDDVSMQSVLDNDRAEIGFKLDQYERPLISHVIMNVKDMDGHRVGVAPKPHNMKKFPAKILIKNINGKNDYLWNRGHLVGNQFAGESSNNPRNITAQTSYTNKFLMLYYEGGANSKNSLSGWVKSHPDYWLEYQVFAHYHSTLDQVPYKITLAWRALDENGQAFYIDTIKPSGKVGDTGMVTNTANKWRFVTIDNIQPNYVFSYVDGLMSTSDLHRGEPEEMMDVKAYLESRY